ncbi:DNA-directed RNA polymerase subunit alpha [Patescibacteria group bacterium]
MTEDYATSAPPNKFVNTIDLPSKVEFSDLGDRKGTLVIEPLFPGYGTTIGNALRRVLLSSLPGAAVTAVKIKGVDHEFSTIPEVEEDVVEIILNLKKLRMKIHSDQPIKLTLQKEGKGKVTAKDIKVPSDIEISTPDLEIANLTSDKAKLDMEITTQAGRGYVPVEQREKDKLDIGTIAVDAIFSPIRSVSFQVENIRVGQMTDYDKITMSIRTDGTLTPKEAVDQAASILVDHFGLFTDVRKKKTEVKVEKVEPEKIGEEKTDTILGENDEAVEELKLSTRTTNALYSAGLKTLGEVIGRNEQELLDLPGFGETALKEIKKLLKKRGLELKE